MFSLRILAFLLSGWAASIPVGASDSQIAVVVGFLLFLAALTMCDSSPHLECETSPSGAVLKSMASGATYLCAVPALLLIHCVALGNIISLCPHFLISKVEY